MKKIELQNGQQVITIEKPQQEIKVDLSIPQTSLSAYQLFIKDKKVEGKFTLQVMGQMWKDLPLDYKQQQDLHLLKRYLEKAKIMKEQMQQQQLLNAPPQIETYFPISRIKTILKEDESKPQFKQEGYQFLSKAIEGFGELILQKIKEQVKRESRKTIREDDLITLIKENQELQFLDCLTNQNQKKKQSNNDQQRQSQQIDKKQGAMDKYIEKQNI